MLIKKKNSFKIIKNKLFENIKNFVFYLFCFQVIVFLCIFFWYQLSPIKKVHTPEKIINLISSVIFKTTGLEAKKSTNYLNSYIKSIYFNLLPPKIPKLYLNLNQKSVIALEFQRQNRANFEDLNKEDRNLVEKYVNGTLLYEQNEYPIKLRVKGDREIHFSEPNITSYKIDITSDDRLNGLEEFSIQKPIARNYIYEYIFQKLSKESEIISLDYSVVNFFVNGIDRGIFVIEEGFSKELLEKNGRRNGPIFGINDRQGRNFPEIIFEAYSELDWFLNDPDKIKSGYSILNSLKENKVGSYENFINWDQWAKYFAVSDLLETYHGVLPRSARFYYNPIIGKIDPISFDGHKGTGDFSNFIILDFLNERSSCSWICDERDWFLKFFLKDENNLRDEFIKKYLKHLDLITEKKYIDNFLSKYQTEIKLYNNAFYKDFSKVDKIFWEGVAPYIYDDKYLYKRAKFIRNKINKINFDEFIFSKNNDKLTIKGFLNSTPIKIIPNCEKENDMKKEYWVYKNSTIDWKNNCEKIIISDFNNFRKKLYIYNNPKLNSNYFPMNLTSFKPFEDTIKNIKKGKFIIPIENSINIRENTLLNKNLVLKLKKNQNIYLSNGATLVIYGDLQITGDKNNKSKIEGLEPDYGSLILNGNTNNISNTIFNNLKAPNLKGFSLYGAVNFINSKNFIRDTIFKKSHSEDFINFINSKTELENIELINTASDAIDVDEGELKFINLKCRNIGNDCLDFSNSEINGRNFFAEKVQDKSISVGEGSKVEIKNLSLNNSEIAIAVKDSSKANISNIKINNSTVPFAVFVKKSEYGPAYLKVDNLILNKSNDVFLVDKISTLEVNGKRIFGNLEGKNIEGMMYGNLYGKQTKR